MARSLCLLGLLVLAELSLGNPTNGKFKKFLQKRYDPMHNECEVIESDRVQCGAKTFNEAECRQRGCCFEPCEGCNASIPWCFAAQRMMRTECAVRYEDKDDCGYYGIGEGECFMRGCCWRPSHLPNDPPCFHQLSLRLVDGPTEASGRVEINHDGQWGTVCDDNFGSNEANVVCRSLGYTYGTARGYATYGSGSGPIWLDGMSCNGDEARLEDCRHPGWGVHDCSHSEDSGVDCSNDEPTVDTYNTYPYEYYTYDSYYDTYSRGESAPAGAGRTGFRGKPGKKRRAVDAPRRKKAAKHMMQRLHKKSLAKKMKI